MLDLTWLPSRFPFMLITPQYRAEPERPAWLVPCGYSGLLVA